jgi:hypothetical protein
VNPAIIVLFASNIRISAYQRSLNGPLNRPFSFIDLIGENAGLSGARAGGILPP